MQLPAPMQRGRSTLAFSIASQHPGLEGEHGRVRAARGADLGVDLGKAALDVGVVEVRESLVGRNVALTIAFDGRESGYRRAHRPAEPSGADRLVLDAV